MLFHVRDGSDSTIERIHPGDVEPILFLSRECTGVEKRYGSTEMEVACLVWAVRKLRLEISSSVKPVIVLTDHSATKQIVQSANLHTVDINKANAKLIDASVFLSQFKLIIKHIAGKTNLVSNALSRLPIVADTGQGDPAAPGELERIGDVSVLWTESVMSMPDSLRTDIQQAYSTDKKYKSIQSHLRSNSSSPAKLERYPFVERDGLLYHRSRRNGKERLCVPRSCHSQLFRLAHDEKFHASPELIRKDLAEFVIDHATRRIRDYTACCPTCLQAKTHRTKPPGALQPIDCGDNPFEVVTTDLVVALPEVPMDGTPYALPGVTTANALMTWTCKFSKKVLLIAGREDYTAEQWATATLRMWLLADWGIPRKMISDRDRKFVSKFWKQVFGSLRVQLAVSTSYYP